MRNIYQNGNCLNNKIEVIQIYCNYHCAKVKVSPLQATGDVDARVHIFTATALGRGRVASPTLGLLYPRGKPLVLIL